VKFRRPRSTNPGEHRPVLLQEVLETLAIQPGNIVVDCTLGFAGHSFEMLKAVGTEGCLIALDLDSANLASAEERLGAVGNLYSLHHGNFAGVPQVLGEVGYTGCDALLADLGVSSMQIDTPERGFSFARTGPLDMRMDPTRGRTAFELMQTLSTEELAEAFSTFGDEPQAEKIALAIVEQFQNGTPPTTTRELAKLISDAAPVIVNYNPLPGQARPRQQKIRPIARVFQALRILVNRELSNLQELLRVLPWILNPGGRAAFISFHSGEDRIVKRAFREGHRNGLYSKISDDPIRAGHEERYNNPRSRSAKLRWAIRATS